MALVEVAVLYAALGVGCGVAVIIRRQGQLSDALILVALWPLFAPFVLSRPAAKPGAISELLPSDASVAPLKQRMGVARNRLVEIDAMLATPAFDLDALDERIAALEGSEASSRALASAESRRRSVERLADRRKMLASELQELAELFLQLETQTEVMRLAGHTEDSVGELVADIQARLESIDEVEAVGLLR